MQGLPRWLCLCAQVDWWIGVDLRCFGLKDCFSFWQGFKLKKKVQFSCVSYILWKHSIVSLERTSSVVGFLWLTVKHYRRVKNYFPVVRIRICSDLLSGLLHFVRGTLVQMCSWFCFSSKKAREKEILKVRGNSNILAIKFISYISNTLLAREWSKKNLEVDFP